MLQLLGFGFMGLYDLLDYIPIALKIDHLFTIYFINLFVENTRHIYGYDCVFRLDLKKLNS